MDSFAGKVGGENRVCAVASASMNFRRLLSAGEKAVPKLVDHLLHTVFGLMLVVCMMEEISTNFYRALAIISLPFCCCY